jgi:hypothetical protein
MFAQRRAGHRAPEFGRQEKCEDPTRARERDAPMREGNRHVSLHAERAPRHHMSGHCRKSRPQPRARFRIEMLRANPRRIADHEIEPAR